MRKTKEYNHILISSWGYPTQKTKGNPFVKELAEALLVKGNKTSIIQYHFVNPFSFLRYIFFGDKFQKSEGIKFVNVFIINVLPFISRYFPSYVRANTFFFVGLRIKIYNIFNGKPDFIQQHFILNSQPYITEFISKKFKIPYILFEHSPYVSSYHANLKLPSFYKQEDVINFVKHAKVRIARTNIFKEHYEKIFGCNFLSIPNFFPEKYMIESGKLQKTNNEFVFISIGTLQAGKNQTGLIDAFSSKFSNTPSKLVIVGEGRDKQKIMQLIETKGLKNQVLLTGLLSRKKVIHALDNSNVLVVSSNNETFGNTIIEALFRGLPIVSTKCGGPEEIINKTNGLLCEKNNEALSDKMWEMYLNYSQYDSAKIISEAKEKYSQNVIINKLMDVYLEIGMVK